jgi:hypothetical protein
MQAYPEERFVNQLVTYTVEVDGRRYVIEHVPARVNVETGEQLFAPETVERLQRIVLKDRTHCHTIQVSIFNFAG